MASNSTEVIGLSQWERTDGVNMDDFNEDNRRIEAALVERPRIARGSYTGNGTYGPNNTLSITFPFKPFLIIIMRRHAARDYGGLGGTFPDRYIFGADTETFVTYNYNSSTNTTFFSWSGNTLTWYNDRSLVDQLNLPNEAYEYFAFG